MHPRRHDRPRIGRAGRNMDNARFRKQLLRTGYRKYARGAGRNRRVARDESVRIHIRRCRQPHLRSLFRQRHAPDGRTDRQKFAGGVLVRGECRRRQRQADTGQHSGAGAASRRRRRNLHHRQYRCRHGEHIAGAVELHPYEERFERNLPLRSTNLSPRATATFR